jgi:hypothetical protein
VLRCAVARCRGRLALRPTGRSRRPVAAARSRRAGVRFDIAAGESRAVLVPVPLRSRARLRRRGRAVALARATGSADARRYVTLAARRPNGR